MEGLRGPDKAYPFFWLAGSGETPNIGIACGLEHS